MLVAQLCPAGIASLERAFLPLERLEQDHPGLYLGSLGTLQRRMGEWRISHAEQVVGQQMGAIRDQENSQLHSKKPMPAGRQLDG